MVGFAAALAAALCLACVEPAHAQAKTGKEPTAAQLASRERQAKCAAEWKHAKSGGTLAPAMKWPKFWSACNARLKGHHV